MAIETHACVLAYFIFHSSSCLYCVLRVYVKSYNSQQGHLRDEGHSAAQLKQVGTYIRQLQNRNTLETDGHCSDNSKSIHSYSAEQGNGKPLLYFTKIE